MARLTGTDAVVARRCAAPGWIRWAHSTWDGLVHAFPIEGSQHGRWLRAVCSFTVPPAALGPATVVGPRCPRCVLAIEAACTAPHRGDRPDVCARLLACRRRDRQLATVTQVPDITLPPTTAQPAEHELRAAGMGPGAAALVARHPDAAR